MTRRMLCTRRWVGGRQPQPQLVYQLTRVQQGGSPRLGGGPANKAPCCPADAASGWACSNAASTCAAKVG